MPDNGRILIDDLEGTPYAARLPGGQPMPAPGKPFTSEREDWLKRYNVSPLPIGFEEGEDPRSLKYLRLNLDETPGSILHFWFAHSADRLATLSSRIVPGRTTCW